MTVAVMLWFVFGAAAGGCGYWLGWRAAFHAMARNRVKSEQFLDRLYQRYQAPPAAWPGPREKKQ